MLTLKKRGNWYQVEGRNAMGVHIPRHSIGIRVLDRETRAAAAKRVLELEKLTEWHGPHTTKVVEFPKPPGLTLAEAYEKWLAQYPEGKSTWKAFRNVKRLLVEPLAAQGIVLVKEVNADHLNALQNGWLNEGKTVNTIQNFRKFTSCLFNYCVNILEEISRNPWKSVKAIREIRPTREQIMAGKRKDKGIATLPLDLKGNSNWLLIQTHAPAFARGELSGQPQYRTNPLIVHHPDTFPTLLWLMYETGLRRSDALIFQPGLIVNTQHGGSYTTAQVKTGDEVTVFLTQDLVDQLRALPLLKWRGAADAPGAGLCPFYDGSYDQEQYMQTCLNRPLRRLGKLIGVPGLRPHRFRDSFAVRMLSLGLSLDDVQRMLGHRSIATTQKYYAHYVVGYQEAVENRQAAARQAALYTEAQAAAPREVSVN